MHGWYFYTVLLAFTTGIGVASVVTLSWPIIFLALIIAGGLGILGYYHRHAPGSVTLIFSAVALVAFALGAGRFMLVETAVMTTDLNTQVGQEITLEGMVVREPDMRERTTRLTVATGDTLLLVSTDRYGDIEYGDTIRVTGKLELPVSFTTDLGRTFDYPGYLRARGITHTMSFVIPDVITPAPPSVTGSLFTLKHNFMQALETVISEPQVGLGEGLLLGVKQSLGDELEQAFRTSGLVHIIVLSGYNIMLIVSFVLYVLSFFLGMRARMVVGLLAIVAFAVMVGLGATVLRASIMAAIFLLVSVTSRRYLVLRSLFLAGALMLLVNPYLLLYDIGFQLSFMATWGLVLVAPQFEQLFDRVGTVYGLRSFLVATLATQIAVLPLLVYHIGAVSLVAIVANVVVLPMVPVAMLLTFITGVVTLLVPALALPFAFLAYYALSYIMVLATWFASWPGASVAIPPVPWYIVPVLYLAIAGGVYYFWRRSAAKPTLALPARTTRDTMNWTIEVEDEVVRPRAQIQNERTEVRSPASEDDIPIFFR
jgi:competence protein ComEC